MAPEGEITTLLRQWREGDKQALDLLMPLVYPRLRAIAGSLSRNENDPVTQPTALVHEAYMRLLDQQRLCWTDRVHFYSFAAQLMRHILIDESRARMAGKRGGSQVRVPLHEDISWVSVNSPAMLDLNLALNELNAFDSHKVKLIELRYFLGCTASETAELTGSSKASVDRELQVARAWLFRQLNGDAQART